MAKTIITTNMNIEEEIQIIKCIEAKEKELKELREEKESQIKALLDNAGLEELQVGAYTIRFVNVVRNNFNTSAFKKKYLELYNAFIKQTNYRKFTIS
jgi:predicted phage-related endonuclease